MTAAPRDENRKAGLVVANVVGSTALVVSGFSLSGVGAAAVAIVDGSGVQITSFGGGTQYTNGGTPPANPVGPTLEFNNAGAWATVGSANPLPVSGSFSLTNPSTGAAVPATANYIAGNKGGNLTGLLIGSQTTANSLAVALASDQVSIPVVATLTAETTKVIGVVRTADGAGNLLTSNSTTYTAKFGLDGNLLGTLGTAFTTAGKVDIKGADGDVFVRQATAASLNATVVGTGTFVVQATLAAETTKVIGTARIIGNGGATLDSTVGAGTAPANQVVVGALYNSTEISPSTGQAFALQADSKGRLRGVIMDAAGNTRGANVDSSNRLSVTIDNIAAAQTLATVTTVTTLTGTTTLTPGTGAANLGKAEDAVAGTGDTGVFSLGVANEAQSSLAADGDYIAQATDTKGNRLVIGNIAHDGADAGAPVKIGGKATNVEPTAVSATADRTNLITDMVGKLIVLPYANPENFVSGAITSAMTGTTSTSLIAAPASGLRNYITTIIVSNAHATVGTDVIIQDGSGGTTLLSIPAAAVYGGAVITLPTPLRQPTTATAIYCANVTTGASTKVSAVGYKGV